jgi:hypothetical protein
MPNPIIIIIILFVLANVAIGAMIYFNIIPQNVQTKDVIVSNTSKIVSQPAINQTVNKSVVGEACFNSTLMRTQEAMNITNVKLKESRYFEKSSSAANYLVRNWSNTFYDINGTQRDFTDKTTISMVELITNRQRNFTIPIVCDENGTIGKYSSCLLKNVPNIPSACINLTINMTECDQEWSEHFLMDDIDYWVSPPGGSIVISSSGTNDTSVRFNFTIRSGRNRLESFGMFIIQRTFSPMNDNKIFSQTKLTLDGAGGTIYKDVNITDMRGTEIYTTVWFKKKCYDKFVIY